MSRPLSGRSRGPRLPRVTFVGLGTMGEPMAKRVALASFELTIFDIDVKRAEGLAVEMGVPFTRDILATASECDVVILMLPNSTIVEKLLREQGLFKAMPVGSLIIDMGSSRPESTRALAEEAQARGLRFLDAPVSGGQAKAQAGELAIMVGGLSSDFDSALPLLSQMGSWVVHTGSAGTGHAMKALNNLLSATGLLAAIEVISAGAKFGLSPSVMLDVFNHSTGSNHATQVKIGRFVLSRAFDSGFALDLMVKDLRTASELVVETGSDPSVSSAVVASWKAAQAFLGDPSADHTAIARWVENATSIPLKP